MFLIILSGSCLMVTYLFGIILGVRDGKIFMKKMKDETIHLNLPTKVKDHWLTNPKRWNTDLLLSIFKDDFVQHIMQVRLTKAGGEDILVWTPNKRGTWTTQSAYKLLCQGKINETVRSLNRHIHTNNLIDSIWKNKKILPKVQVFM